MGTREYRHATLQRTRPLYCCSYEWGQEIGMKEGRSEMAWAGPGPAIRDTEVLICTVWLWTNSSQKWKWSVKSMPITVLGVLNTPITPFNLGYWQMLTTLSGCTVDDPWGPFLVSQPETGHYWQTYLPRCDPVGHLTQLCYWLWIWKVTDIVVSTPVSVPCFCSLL